MSISVQHGPIPSLPFCVKAIVYTSATALAASTAAMAIFLTIFPNMSVVGYSLLAGAEGLSFATFIVSLLLLHRKQSQVLKRIQRQAKPLPSSSQAQERELPHQLISQLAQHLKLERVTHHPLALGLEESEEIEVASILETEKPPLNLLIEEFQQELPQLFDAIEKLLTSYVKAYHRFYGKSINSEKERSIKKFVELIRNIDNILNDRQQLSPFAYYLLEQMFSSNEEIFQFLDTHSIEEKEKRFQAVKNIEEETLIFFVVFEFFRIRLWNILPYILKQRHELSQDTTLKIALYSSKGMKFALEQNNFKDYINRLPLIDTCKERLISLVDEFFIPVFREPLYYGIYDTFFGKSFASELDKHIFTKDFFTAPKVKEKNWSAQAKAFTQFINQIVKKLDQIQ